MAQSRVITPGRHRLDLSAIGDRIRQLRGFKLSQAEFAARIEITQSHLSALERGIKEPGAAVLFAISQEFGRSVDWLLTGQNFVMQPKEPSKKSSKLSQ